MKTTLFALAAGFGIIFAIASVSVAETSGERSITPKSGKAESGKMKRLQPLRGAPALQPESHGGTLDGGRIIFF